MSDSEDIPEEKEVKKSLPVCTAEIFEKMCIDTTDAETGEVKKFGWKSLVTSGQKTSEHLLSMLSTKYIFSDGEIETIKGWEGTM